MTRISIRFAALAFLLLVASCGGETTEPALEADDLDLVGGVEAPGNPAVGQDVGETLGTKHLGVHIVDDLETVVGRADVVVAFTAPPSNIRA